jgi:hypothetical protein
MFWVGELEHLKSCRVILYLCPKYLKLARLADLTATSVNVRQVSFSQVRTTKRVHGRQGPTSARRVRITATIQCVTRKRKVDEFLQLTNVSISEQMPIILSMAGGLPAHHFLHHLAGATALARFRMEGAAMITNPRQLYPQLLPDLLQRCRVIPALGEVIDWHSN